MVDNGLSRRRRGLRRDAEANRERLLAAAVTAMLREGRNVPLATIAAEAGVGVGTLYRKYPDRTALMRALEHRAYGLLNDILDDIETHATRRRWTGLRCIEEYLSRCRQVADQLVLPLQGAPPLVDETAVVARRNIYRRLDYFIERGGVDGTVRPDANATDVIVFTTLITRPVPHSKDWNRMSGRQQRLFLDGMATPNPRQMPASAVTAADVERGFHDPGQS
jgi:AcrR family transcriptional regulator